MIPLFKVNMTHETDELIDDLKNILLSGYIGEGEEVVKFEKELQNVLKCVPTPISTNCCTNSIFLALLSLGVGAGDEVITTAMTCTATNSPIVLLGATPVWADVDRKTGNIDPRSVKARITRKTRAIIAVDWTGRHCNYSTLKALGVPVIQDAAHGPLYDQWNCGDVTCLSFGPIKHLTSGDGGAIIVNRTRHFSPDELKLLRWYGLDRTSSQNFRCEQNIKRVGGKFHMNNINASIGRSNLVNLEDIILSHKSNAEVLYRRINNKYIETASFDPKSNYWVYPILLPTNEDRDKLQIFLKENEIEASRVHARNDIHTGFSFPGPSNPGLDEFDSRQLNLPCGQWVTRNDLDKIISVVNSFTNEKRKGNR